MLEGLEPARQKRTCLVQTLLGRLEEADQRILVDAVNNPDVWPVKTLSRALSARGLKISETPIKNHRSQECVCFKG